MKNMKMKACREFSKILGEICPEMVRTEDDIKAMENVFHKIRKKLTKRALLWHFLIKNEYLYKIGLLVAKFRLKLKRNR